MTNALRHLLPAVWLVVSLGAVWAPAQDALRGPLLESDGDAEVWQPEAPAPARIFGSGDAVMPDFAPANAPRLGLPETRVAEPGIGPQGDSTGPGLVASEREAWLALPGCPPLSLSADKTWRWQLFPTGLLYPAYLAGVREPRMGIQIFKERDQTWYFDAALGGRLGLVRYGSDAPVWAEGWQLDVEAAALPRMTLDEYRDMIATDFRYGFPLTWRRGPVELKLAFYHLSSHLGDEYILHGRPLHAGGKRFERVNFLRDTLVAGVALRPTDSIRLYAEAGWAFNTDGGSEPWELQFGAEYSLYAPTGPGGSPFLAVNAHLREEVDFGGGLTVQTGWQWRLAYGRLVRVGFHYFNGLSEQYEFHTEHEEQFGVGFWYDF